SKIIGDMEMSRSNPLYSTINFSITLSTGKKIVCLAPKLDKLVNTPLRSKERSKSIGGLCFAQPRTFLPITLLYPHLHLKRTLLSHLEIGKYTRWIFL